jgi:hypothetical protein
MRSRYCAQARTTQAGLGSSLWRGRSTGRLVTRAQACQIDGPHAGAIVERRMPQGLVDIARRWLVIDVELPNPPGASHGCRAPTPSQPSLPTCSRRNSSKPDTPGSGDQARAPRRPRLTPASARRAAAEDALPLYPVLSGHSASRATRTRRAKERLKAFRS